MQDLKDLPVLILAYNRFDKFVRCLESVYKKGIKKIYISIDGPRNDFDINNQRKIISICEENIFNLDIKVNHFKSNFGCRMGPINGITWFFSQNKYGVVLEDDVIITRKCFEAFLFLLETKKTNEEFMSISSFNEFSNKSLESIYSIPVWRSWGWASWADRWQYHLNFSMQIRKLNTWELYKLMPKNLQSIETVKLVKACQLNLLDAWDYEFNFTHVVNSKNSLTMGGINTLVYGFDRSGTHTIDLASVNINFDLFCEREFDLKKIRKLQISDKILLLRKCGFFYKKNISWLIHILNFFKFLYNSLLFRLRIIKRIIYKILKIN